MADAPEDPKNKAKPNQKDKGTVVHTAFGQKMSGHLSDIADGDDPKAKIRLTATADDLLALVDGKLDMTRAWTSGRISINANPFDLLKLRKLL